MFVEEYRSLGAGRFGTTKKPGLSGFSDTRSTPENEDKIPKNLLLACHQFWGQGVQATGGGLTVTTRLPSKRQNNNGEAQDGQ